MGGSRTCRNDFPYRIFLGYRINPMTFEPISYPVIVLAKAASVEERMTENVITNTRE